MNILQGLISIFFTFFITRCASKFNSGLVLQYRVLYRLLAIMFNQMSVLKAFLETKPRGFVVSGRFQTRDFSKIYRPQNEYIFIATATFTQNSCSRVLLFSRARFLEHIDY